MTSQEEKNIAKDDSDKEKEKIEFIPKETIKRLLLDVKEMIKSPLDDQGIYYKHCEKNMLKGYAMIVGPEGSNYQGGYYFFMFDYPINYPFSPPSLTFLTNDGFTRMHPNLYKKGKVCLSIINTWKGEQWTACQSIKSILLTIISVLDNEPMLHEPGITKKHSDYEPYNKTIIYKNIDFCILSVLDKFKDNNDVNIDYKDYFYPFMIESFKKNIPYILNKIDENKNKNEFYRVGLYTMQTMANYIELKKKLTNIANKFNITI